jgi:hypothetical protein
VIVPQCGPEEKSFLKRIFLRGKEGETESQNISGHLKSLCGNSDSE